MPRKPLNLSIASVAESNPNRETKAAKSRRLANQRFKILARALRSVGRLGTVGYELSSEETEKLISASQREFDYMIQQLRHGVEGQEGDLF